jgi:plasmid stability protein
MPMTLTIHLQPDQEALLKAKAAREGRSEEEIAREAVERLLSEESAPPRRRIRDFRGMAAHARTGMDAQEYVNRLREEWDHRL